MNFESKPRKKVSLDALRRSGVSDAVIREYDQSAVQSGNFVSSISGSGDYWEATTLIMNKTGIHARLASLFVQTASKFKSKVTLSAYGKTIDAKSILMIMSMGLVMGTEITIKAQDPDAADAVKTLADLVDAKFYED